MQFWEPLMHMGLAGAALSTLIWVVRQLMHAAAADRTAFRQELQAERQLCELHHSQVLTELKTLAGAVRDLADAAAPHPCRQQQAT